MIFNSIDIRNAPKMAKRLMTNSNDAPVGLPVKGQGIGAVRVENNQHPFSMILSTQEGGQGDGFSLHVEQDVVSFYQLGKKTPLETLALKGVGLDEDKACRYWFSLDPAACCLRYGKGEMRLLTTLMEHKYADPQDENDTSFDWVKEVSYVTVNTAAEELEAWRDPVTIDPPIVVVPSKEMTMDMAANYWATVPEGLTPACQALYGNVSGEHFTLNTPDFPDFTDAIEYSIRSEDGWCHKKLLEKATEFGEKPNYEETYLRITMGRNQGNSPGIPYVVEIWPPGHYSPIHNHAGADAIIRVLHGEITVNLYPMLSEYHQKPFARKVFKKNNITWLSPLLNQTHQLKNANINGPTCITIQCYQYGELNNSHYEYFDYLNEDTGLICQFTPNSDMDFIEFKALMRQEWQGVIGRSQDECL